MVKKTGAVKRAWARPAPAPKAYGESGDGSVGRSGSGGAVLRRRPLAASCPLARRRPAFRRGLPRSARLRLQQDGQHFLTEQLFLLLGRGKQGRDRRRQQYAGPDRKSTRLNSSH